MNYDKWKDSIKPGLPPEKMEEITKNVQENMKKMSGKAELESILAIQKQLLEGLQVISSSQLSIFNRLQAIEEKLDKK